MRPRPDLTGQRFGRLLVLERGENDRGGRARWACRCACGATTLVKVDNLRRGRATSCGCWRRARAAVTHLAHGHTRRLLSGRATTEYMTWLGMRQRCTNPNRADFKRYGGRGVTVCAAWRESFAAFLDDMGLKPRPDLSLDRINNDLGYFKENCRWATRKQQRANRRPKEETYG